jgi:hypothetical protein
VANRLLPLLRPEFSLPHLDGCTSACGGVCNPTAGSGTGTCFSNASILRFFITEYQVYYKRYFTAACCFRLFKMLKYNLKYNVTAFRQNIYSVINIIIVIIIKILIKVITP